MSYPTGVLECLVRIQTATTLGSGILFGRDTVLTCAHVLNNELLETVRADPDILQRNGTKSLFRNKHGDIFREIEGIMLFDGTESTAKVDAIHINEDLVLLRLDAPMDRAVFPPPFGDWAAPDTMSSSTHSAYGFGACGPKSYEIRSNFVAPIGQADVELGSNAAMFSGNATPGMSGGPVIGRIGSSLYLVGLTVLGRIGLAHGRLIEAKILKEFLAKYASEETLRGYQMAGQRFGLETRLESREFNHRQTWQWVRQAGSSEFRKEPARSIYYIASRPLLMSDIDVLWDRPRSPALAAARSRCFAELTAKEAEATIEKLRSQSGLAISLPAHKKPFGNLSRVKRRALPIECDSSIFDADGFPILPEDVAEWRAADGEPRRFFPGDPNASDGERIHFAMSDSRALLRPQLSVPVWSDS